jgi:CRP-like cAMP-binding protein
VSAFEQSRRGCGPTITVQSWGPSYSYHVSQQVIGTSRETITRTLSEFRKKDIVELKGSTLITHNKPALQRPVAA